MAQHQQPGLHATVVQFTVEINEPLSAHEPGCQWSLSARCLQVCKPLTGLHIQDHAHCKMFLLCASGHSLGGALATLAAYDIRKALQACGQGDAEVMCYSFGAPRTGNHAFARDYNCVVPDTWSIINDQACLGRKTCFACSLHTQNW